MYLEEHHVQASPKWAVQNKKNIAKHQTKTPQQNPGGWVGERKLCKQSDKFAVEYRQMRLNSALILISV